MNNFVYRLYGDFGGLYAAETLSSPSNRQVKWDAYMIRFHYPAEHVVLGKTYDLEMKIFHKVINFICLTLLRIPSTELFGATAISPL